jgi:hypothetical protein
MAYYSANPANFESARALTEDEMRQMAPSIFATEAHHSRSERFAPIPTWEVLKGLMNEGFMPVAARQNVVRIDDRRNYTKHLVRLRRLNDGRKYSVGDTVLEMLLKNGNDGTSVYDLFAGLFRVTCLNSMVAQTGSVDQVKVKHVGKDIVGKVIDGTYRVLNSANRLLEAPVEWSQIKLNNEERQAFAAAAMVTRFGDKDGVVHTPIQPVQMLIPRRTADTGHDLWSTFNVVQENAVRGGLSGMRQTDDGRWRRATTLEITGIDQDIKLNKALWVLAEKMAELKAA